MTAGLPDLETFRVTADHRDRLAKSGHRHKFDYGHVVVGAGPALQGGAARLAARAALRIGAGLVTVLAHRDAADAHAAQLNAIMLQTYDQTPRFAGQLAVLSPDAICVGPNFGTSVTAREKLNVVLAQSVPLCLDADAITMIAQDRQAFSARASDRVVLTPHAGELRRLIPGAFDRTDCRVTLARTAARDLGCVVLFKGPDTLVAQPDGTCVVVSSDGIPHAAWLATAGAGDVLAGFITGLLARGFAPACAAALGAHLHLQCAAVVGPGLVSEDLPDALPRVLSAMLSEP
ncbi:NAD(P)H-hydrate dehydratase [Loktanella sp. TSTF-M6]|uniref:ADP-dependent (S)-NAD(P)H-hydrate dehydratase n=1 Tax=Loktanella gaetbuli TaxID=2881335 RepID=A0ABS8BW16_9RHOB|nr:NAD(P)H-hydrate dehydratase [Loktanella gaetbuli]MCB5199946.1 NAD(P)H-hydrate dehydratase [Loktanella gaetbuli]